MPAARSTNGSYTLSTGGNSDGAAVGKYKVTIVVQGGVRREGPGRLSEESGKDNPKLPPHFTAKAQAQAKSLIPLGYGDVRTTTLTADVKAESNKINFELDDKNAPPDPTLPVKSKGGRR